MAHSLHVLQNHHLQRIPSIILLTPTRKYYFNIPSSFMRHSSYHSHNIGTKNILFFTKFNTLSANGLHEMLLIANNINKPTSFWVYGGSVVISYMEQLRFKLGSQCSHFSAITWQGHKLRLGLDKEFAKQLRRQYKFRFYFKALNSLILDRVPKELQVNAKDFLVAVESPNPYFQDEQWQFRPFEVISNGRVITNYVCKPISNDNSHVGSFILLHFDSLACITKTMNDGTFLGAVESLKQCTVVHVVEDCSLLFTEEYQLLMDKFSAAASHLMFCRGVRNEKSKLEDFLHDFHHIKLTSRLSQAYPKYFPNLMGELSSFLTTEFRQFRDISSLFPRRKVDLVRKFHASNLGAGNQYAKRTDLFKSLRLEEYFRGASIHFPLLKRSQEELPKNIAEFDPEVIFLGTCSGMPHKFRNVSSILLRLPSGSSMMWDCGVNSFQQLRDHYSGKQLEEVLLSLKVIFVTHIHSDHSMGILDIISERNSLLQQRGIALEAEALILIIPWDVVPWYDFCSRKVQTLHLGCKVLFTQTLRGVEENKKRPKNKNNCFFSNQKEEKPTVLIDPKTQSYYFKVQSPNKAYFDSFLAANGITDFQPIPVNHCKQSYGVVMTHSSKVKISYSGDTTPHKQFQDAAKDSTLLIHEATYSDRYLSEAERDKHSTISQAVKVGMDSGCWRTALTHFHEGKSKEHLSSFPSEDMRIYHRDSTIYCSDHLRSRLSQMRELPQISLSVLKMVQGIEQKSRPESSRK